MTLPAPGVPIKGPSPQSPNTTTVPVNKDGDEDSSMEDENDPGVILVESMWNVWLPRQLR